MPFGRRSESDHERTAAERERAAAERAARRAQRDGEPVEPPPHDAFDQSLESEEAFEASGPPRPADSPLAPPPAAQPPPLEPEPAASDPRGAAAEAPAHTHRLQRERAALRARLGQRPHLPGRGSSPRPGPRGSRLPAVLAVAALVAVLVALFLLFQPFKGDGHGQVAVVVPQGSSVGQIGDLLSSRGVVSSGFVFGLRARLDGDSSKLKPGSYVLARDMSYGAALSALTKGPKTLPVFKLTIPEGRSRRETAALVKQTSLTGDYLQASAHATGLRPRDYGAPRRTTSLEGFLFPATYELRAGAPVARLVAEQLAAFKANFAGIRLRYARRKNLTRYDVITIASMIEREAQVPRDRRLIAAVIYNRLHRGMPLGIDATIRYQTGNWTRSLRASDLSRDTPYNTRLHRGLPPTPIGNPGVASLKAAARPARVSYLFYVVKPNTCGEHAFSSTDARFQRDVARYNAARAKNGGRAPTRCPSG
jgi:uncharacterized YceG family protein